MWTKRSFAELNRKEYHKSHYKNADIPSGELRPRDSVKRNLTISHGRTMIRSSITFIDHHGQENLVVGCGEGLTARWPNGGSGRCFRFE